MLFKKLDKKNLQFQSPHTGSSNALSHYFTRQKVYLCIRLILQQTNKQNKTSKSFQVFKKKTK